MSDVYGFLVGINKYLNSKNNLKGCVNDVNSFKEYLNLNFASEKLLIKTLVNEKATKANIVNGFKLFKKARKGDLCIFYFSGHGSTWNAPECFHHLMPDKKFRSLVCHDSREGDKIDLMDKELAFLIWEANYKKEIQFLVITDCCHSGGVTKDEDINSNTFQSRQLENEKRLFPFQKLYGFENTNEEDILSGNFQFKRGNHIHLAACRGDQKAIEGEMNDKRRGVFTYHLVETLKQHSNQINYIDLIKKVNTRIQKKIANQSPQLFVVRDEDAKLNILSNTIDTGKSIYQVCFKENLGWVINAGLINSHLKKFDQLNYLVKVINDNIELPIQQIHSTYTKLTRTNALTVGHIYDAHLIHLESKKVKIDLKGIPQNLIEELINEYEKEKASYSFLLTADAGHAIFSLKYNEDIGFFLSLIMNDSTLFKRNKGYARTKINDLLIAIDKIIKWNNLLNLENDQLNFDKAIKVNLFKTITPGSYNDNVKKEFVENIDTIKLEYQYANGKYHAPGFQLSITNIGQYPLWVSLLYMDEDYCISNRLIAKELLGPQSTVWALDCLDNGVVCKTLIAELPEKVYKQGRRNIRDYLKLIISTEEFDTYSFNQTSVASNKNFKDLRGERHKFQCAGWSTKTICFEIYHP